MENMIYYAQSVDPKMLWAIDEILRVQSWPTRDTEENARMLLDYSATYLNSILRYKDSNMVLHVDSDTTYITITEERSCYAGHFYLSDWPSPIPIKTNPERNGPCTRSVKQSVTLSPHHLKLKRVAPSTTGKNLSVCDQP